MKKLTALLMALMLLWTAAVLAEETGEQVFDWDGQGQVKLTQVADYSDDMNLMVDGKPEGKWVVVVFTILDGAEMDPSKAFDYAKASVTMDDFPIASLAGRGARVDVAAGKAVLVGDIVVFFDVPADYDASAAVVKVNGVTAAVAVPEE